MPQPKNRGLRVVMTLRKCFFYRRYIQSLAEEPRADPSQQHLAFPPPLCKNCLHLAASSASGPEAGRTTQCVTITISEGPFRATNQLDGELNKIKTLKTVQDSATIARILKINDVRQEARASKASQTVDFIRISQNKHFILNVLIQGIVSWIQRGPTMKSRQIISAGHVAARDR